MLDRNPQDQSYRQPSAEVAADLTEFDDADLATEARREVLRDSRQARTIEAANAALLRKRESLSLGILILAALGAAAATVVGFVTENDEYVRWGLLAFGPIYGASLVQGWPSWRRRR